ncbi:MAG: sigma-70 family RNA polymerase sigma factor [Saprospiraceae bacterium]|nr:sigma-70 family RNA polymerase sigma factor [Saprospiraceae bacterium]
MDKAVLIAIGKAKKGERLAQKKLFDHFLPYLSVVCRRYAYDPTILPDAIQESFIAIFRNLDSYDSRKGPFKAWIRKIAINATLRLTRDRKETEELFEQMIQPPTTTIRISEFESEDLMILLQKMPANYRAVFNLYVIDEFTHREIAQVLGISEMVSRQKLSRARKWLKSRYQAQLKASNFSR